MVLKKLLFVFESIKDESIKEKNDEDINLFVKQLETKKESKSQLIQLENKEYDNFLDINYNSFQFEKLSLDYLYTLVNIFNNKKSKKQIKLYYDDLNILYKICKCDLNKKEEQILFYCFKKLEDSYYFGKLLNEFGRKMLKVHLHKEYKYSIVIDEFNEDIKINIVFKDKPNEVFIYHDTLMQKIISVYNIETRKSEKKVYIIKNKEKVFSYLNNKKYLSDAMIKQCLDVYDYLIKDYISHYKKDKNILSYIE